MQQRRRLPDRDRQRCRPRPGRSLLAFAVLFTAFFLLLLSSTTFASRRLLDKLEEEEEAEQQQEPDWLRTLDTRQQTFDSSSSSDDDSTEFDSSKSLSRHGRDLVALPLVEEDDEDGQQQQSTRTTRRPRQHRNKYEVSEARPIHILFPLPTDEGRRNENPFGITILKAQPVVDEAVEEVYRRELVPLASLKIHFEDSMLSDAHGPNVAINQLVNNQLDCIIGYAFVYALAPVARMSPFWRDKDSNGIPVITSVGLTSNLDNRREYQLMTRISSPYKVVKNAVLALFSEMAWNKSAYLFHEQRHDAANPSIPYGECYLLMASVQPHLYRLNRMEHNYFMFNELNYDHERMRENLRRVSVISNGQCRGPKERRKWQSQN